MPSSRLISLHMWFLLEAEVEKNVLGELEVGTAPVFVAFGLLLPFFLAGKNWSPAAASGKLQSREALHETIVCFL